VTDPLTVLISAGHSEGHALPALALARELRARDHSVTVELSERWREVAEPMGLGFLAARDYSLAPGADGAGAADGAGESTAVEAARELAAAIEERGVDVVVADLVAPGAGLAAEVAGVKDATLIPTLYPVQGAGLPPWADGLIAPRTPFGAALWRAAEPALRPLRPPARWLRRVPAVIAGARVQLGLAPLQRGRAITTYGTVSEGLSLVATFPQLEYPRPWPAGAHVTGPMLFELPHGDVEPPPGDDPLVLVASSTVHDPERELIATALEALEREPVRVLATINSPGAAWPNDVPANARVVDWLSYARAMPEAALVISAGGHGTVVRSLAAGVPVLVWPTGADTAENGARVTWAGAGLSVPRRLQGPAALRSAVRRLLGDASFGMCARRLAAWARDNDGAAHGAELVERYARR
jgi:UDP:flavonoid glycosyltransferase YjiC (YdhE family)